MKKKLLALLLCGSMLSGVCTATALAGGSASLYPTVGSFSFDAATDIGTTFEVDFYLQNAGDMELDNTTLYIIYDPEVVILKQGVEIDESESIIYPRSEVSNGYLISAGSINTAASIVPVSIPIYQKKPDGRKTAAELGEVKLANYTSSYMGNRGLYQITNSGILFGAEFEVVGAGETEIEVVGGASMFNSSDSGNVDVDTSSCRVSVSGGSSTDDDETSTEATTEAAETTTVSANSSSSSSSSSGGGGTGRESSTAATTEAAAEGTTEAAEPNTVGAVTDETGKIIYAFSDIEDLPWAVEAINYLSANGIVNGYKDGTFLPRNNVTRADYTIMLLNTLGIEGTAKENFTDINGDEYYANYVGLAKELGIATGYNDGSFAPTAYVTRQDMMLLTYRALVSQNILTGDVDASALDAFSDKEDISAYAAEGIAAMVKAGIVNGSKGKIEPKSNTTRAQTAVIMYNIISLQMNADR